MSAQWQEKLASFGLEQKDGVFEYPAAPTDAEVLCTLASESVLHVTGEDAEAFLQGQFSNDITVLDTPSSQLSTWSSPKGRVIALFRIIRIDGGYLIKLPTVLLESVLKRLRMFAMLPTAPGKGLRPTDVSKSQVVIEPRDDLIAIGVSGNSAVSHMGDAGGAQPNETVDASDELWITRVLGENPRFEVIGTVEKVSELWSTCLATCKMADESVWRLQNIDAGIPSINDKTTEAFVLQMLNLHLIDGVSFKKGCFPGQEVVARMHYLGKLKRQMFRLGYDGDAAPAPGDEIYKAGGGSAVGKIVDVAGVAANENRLLAVMAIDATEEPLFLDKEASQPVQLLTLPYDLSPAE